MTMKRRLISLTVSSNEELLDWARTSLSEMGIQSLSGRSAANCLRLVEALRGSAGRPPDLILLAEPIRDSNVFRLCQQLHGLEGMATTPVLFLMKDASSLAEHQVRSAGGSALLRQPVAAAALRTAIRQLHASGAAAAGLKAVKASLRAEKRSQPESVPARQHSSHTHHLRQPASHLQELRARYGMDQRSTWHSV